MNIAEINDHYFDTSALILDGCDGCFWALDLQTLGFFFFFFLQKHALPTFILGRAYYYFVIFFSFS